jgi:hypothetical protein
VQLGARSRVLASRGELELAETVASEAARLSERSDGILQHGDTLIDLGAVLKRAGRPSEAMAVIREAIVSYERKGNVVSAARARATPERPAQRAGVVDSLMVPTASQEIHFGPVAAGRVGSIP